MKAVLLAGGLGTRLREETEYRPKPMVMVGGRPILWHIMKNYAHFDVRDFVVCLGYQGDVIRDYFLNYEARMNDFTVHLGSKHSVEYHDAHGESDWAVTLAETGAETMTGGRIFRIRQFVEGERFVATYGDGLADVPIDELLRFHEAHGKIATVTTVRPLSRFGVMDIDADGAVSQFREKPQADGYVNAGFFVFEPEIFDYLDADFILEREPLQNLAMDGQLMSYRHDGWWQPMDTYREFQMLNTMWDEGNTPWKLWNA
jgi:glucose-1-phosphate cytidylyltransferase